jgi:hypothetical protein
MVFHSPSTDIKPHRDPDPNEIATFEVSICDGLKTEFATPQIKGESTYLNHPDARDDIFDNSLDSQLRCR